MKLLRKTAAVFLALFLLLCTLSPVVSVYADGTGDSAVPEGDGGSAVFSTYLSGMPKEPMDGKTPLSQPVFVRSLLEKAGKGYSQSNRYDVNYYDCSSLIQRCLRDLGITQNVPASTYYWDQMLQGYSVGDVVTFYGSDSYVQYRLTARDIPMIGNEQYFETPGTIIVLIAPGLGSGHICVSLGSFGRQDAGLDPAADRLAVIENTENHVASQMEARYGVPASLFTGPGPVSGVRSVWMDEKNLGEDMTNKYGEQSGPYNRIWRVEAFNPSKGVCIDNCAHGTNYTNNVRYVLEPVANGPQTDPPEDAAPEIADISISNVTPEGFRVMAVFTAPAGLKDVLMPAWTEKDGQDDLYWHVAGFLNENTAYCDVKISDHNQESGQYIIHVQVTDVKGRIAVREIRAEVPAPEEPEEPEQPPQEMGFTEAYVYDVTEDGYSVHAEFIAPEGVSQILMPTWTEANGQDDLIWHQASTADGQTVDFRINTADHHSESGLYITHIYVTSPSGKQIIAGVSADVPEPEKALAITGVEVDALSSGGYRVTATFTAPAGVREVLMPTWTDLNWQDDLQWHQADLDGNKAVYYVKTADHNQETGLYYTHVYVYDNTGAYVIEPLTITVPEEEVPAEPEVPEAPEELAITDLVITELSQDGFLVTVTFTAPNGVSEVLMPTWTEANGQDDLIWYRAEISGNTASCYIRTADHNQESGLYITHVYVSGTDGSQVIAGTGAEVPEPGSPEEPAVQDELSIKNVYVADDSPYGYFVYVEFTAPDGISEVLMPTWTEANGQDDLVWYSAEIDSPDLPFESDGPTALCYIPVSDHNYELGKYITHIYLKDPAGKQVIVGFEMTLTEQTVPVDPEPPVAPGEFIYNGLDFAPVFDPEYYLSNYPDLMQAFGTDAQQAFSHFINSGIYEGRTASSSFSVFAYRDRYADLREAFGDNLLLYVEHYLTNGMQEGRIGN